MRIGPLAMASIAIVMLYAAIAAVVQASEEASWAQLRGDVASSCVVSAPSWPGRWLCTAARVLDR